MRNVVEFDELCSDIERYMKAVADGESFAVTRDGVQIADLVPRRDADAAAD
jgi:antitoxin (DNA-binding transcriptional repressor) of toxin-antitoxin stability system